MTSNLTLQQISSLLDQKLNEKLSPIHKELEKHTKILVSHGKILESHGRMLEKHSKMLKSLKKDQNIMLEMLDGEQMNQRKRIDRIEKHLGFSSVA